MIFLSQVKNSTVSNNPFDNNRCGVILIWWDFCKISYYYISEQQKTHYTTFDIFGKRKIALYLIMGCINIM